MIIIGGLESQGQFLVFEVSRVFLYDLFFHTFWFGKFTADNILNSM